MKKPDNTLDLIYNMLAAISSIEAHVRSESSPRVIEDAVVFNLIILGEAASKIPREFTEDNADIAWHHIIGMRHRLVHAYFNIDMNTVWDVVHQDLPKLKHQLTQLSIKLENNI